MAIIRPKQTFWNFSEFRLCMTPKISEQMLYLLWYWENLGATVKMLSKYKLQFEPFLNLVPKHLTSQIRVTHVAGHTLKILKVIIPSVFSIYHFQFSRIQQQILNLFFFCEILNSRFKKKYVTECCTRYGIEKNFISFKG